MAEKRKPGFYWHVHHGVLMEWCFSYEERATFIQREKSRNEVPIRMRLFQPVKGRLPKQVAAAGRAYDRACWASDDARVAYINSNGRASAAKYHAWNQSGMRREQARQTLKDAILRHMPAIEALHKKECRRCPWNGYTIFPW